ncbi:hypothetical protein L6R29_09105 [Myxococcota bacterium]|nr:hypothetical protein [Myxococcota bacterium]
MRERQPKGLRYPVGLCTLLLWLQMACGGGSAECTNDIQVSEYNTSGLKCTQPCDCSNLKYEGYCISGTCISTTRNPAQRKGDIRPCKLLQKAGACEWGQQRAQPDPLKELVWGDCKAEDVGANFPENTKARCLDGLDNRPTSERDCAHFSFKPAKKACGVLVMA